VLINNAGVFEVRRRLSPDGYELTWAVNVLAPFLLASLLLEKVGLNLSVSFPPACHPLCLPCLPHRFLAMPCLPPPFSWRLPHAVTEMHRMRPVL
jgi:hypothetical protein